MSSRFLRFSTVLRDIGVKYTYCSILYSRHTRGLVESWFKCRDMYEFMELISTIASYGTIYAIGTLRGVVYRFLPRSIDELVEALTYDVVFEPSSVIVCQVLKDVTNNIMSLAEISDKVSLKIGKNIVRARLIRPLNLTTLFDLGIRLLKPFTAPPKLL